MQYTEPDYCSHNSHFHFKRTLTRQFIKKHTRADVYPCNHPSMWQQKTTQKRHAPRIIIIIFLIIQLLFNYLPPNWERHLIAFDRSMGQEYCKHSRHKNIQNHPVSDRSTGGNSTGGSDASQLQVCSVCLMSLCIFQVLLAMMDYTTVQLPLGLSKDVCKVLWRVPASCSW